MTVALRLSDGNYMRQTDIEPIIELLSSSLCVELTGFSNVGKSSLMRALAHGDVWLRQLGEEGDAFLPVYIDCNRMLEMTEQGFYELVLRCLQESSPTLAADVELRTAYGALVAPANVFQVPLSFNNGLTAALQNSKYKLILLFDEFDEPFQQIDSRVFLNLRARKDRYGSRLVYVTATVQPLAALRPGDHSSDSASYLSINSGASPLSLATMSSVIFTTLQRRTASLFPRRIRISSIIGPAAIPAIWPG